MVCGKVLGSNSLDGPNEADDSFRVPAAWLSTKPRAMFREDRKSRTCRRQGKIVEDADLIDAAVAAFLLLVPALAEEIERSIPPDTSGVNRQYLRRQKGWAELCLAAQQRCIEPADFARQVLKLKAEEKS